MCYNRFEEPDVDGYVATFFHQIVLEVGGIKSNRGL